ncbi:hypothetical protein CXQ82_18830 [Pseudomonas sp. S09G 359]|nr:hypothetical protein CXQ82_18830 [Pseudomonas sp. S09G 359]
MASGRACCGKWACCGERACPRWSAQRSQRSWGRCAAQRGQARSPQHARSPQQRCHQTKLCHP